MTSSRLSRRPRPLRTPTVCRKPKTPPPPAPPANPNPNDTVYNWYHIDYYYITQHYVADGTLELQKQPAGNWLSSTTYPANGDWASMAWIPTIHSYTTQFRQYKAGVLQFIMLRNYLDIDAPPDWDTGLQTYDLPTGGSGDKLHRIANHL
jgi:hypothetical protein